MSRIRGYQIVFPQSRTQSPQAFGQRMTARRDYGMIPKYNNAYPVLYITQGNWQHFKMVTSRVERLAIIAMYPLSTSVNISNEPHVFRT